jgi:DNA gyrase inhibitor GyrI
MCTKAHGRVMFLPLADMPGHPCAVIKIQGRDNKNSSTSKIIWSSLLKANLR